MADRFDIEVTLRTVALGSGRETLKVIVSEGDVSAEKMYELEDALLDTMSKRLKAQVSKLGK